ELSEQAAHPARVSHRNVFEHTSTAGATEVEDHLPVLYPFDELLVGEGFRIALGLTRREAIRRREVAEQRDPVQPGSRLAERRAQVGDIIDAKSRPASYDPAGDLVIISVAGDRIGRAEVARRIGLTWDDRAGFDLMLQFEICLVLEVDQRRVAEEAQIAGAACGLRRAVSCPFESTAMPPNAGRSLNQTIRGWRGSHDFSFVSAKEIGTADASRNFP